MSQSNDDARSATHQGRGEPNVAAGESTAPPSPEAAPLADDLRPSMPATVEDSGLDFGFLADLALKTVYADTGCTTQRAAERLALPPGVVDTLLQHLYRERLIEIRETLTPQNRRYAMLDRGWERVRRLLDLNAYIGAAPVSLDAYTAMVRRQEELRPPVKPDAIRAAVADLVLPDTTHQLLGVVANSRRSLFITGAPGNGKTSIAERVSAIYGDIIYVPQAIEVDGQIIKVFDPALHKPVQTNSQEDESNSIRKESLDRRYVACKRPVVITGGELTLEMLDLRYDPVAKYYEAPLHIKALGGTFLIDDFGRQLVSPAQLLNRWIVPLESRVDFMKLHTGKTFMIPFDEIVIFSTNLEPSDLMDPAFLRRIPYKLEIKAPTREEYRRIFRLIAQQRGVELPDDVPSIVIEELQTNNGFQLACYQPRFIVDQVIAACKYLGIPTTFSPELVLDALGNMFVNGNWSQKAQSMAA